MTYKYQFLENKNNLSSLFKNIHNKYSKIFYKK